MLKIFGLFALLTTVFFDGCTQKQTLMWHDEEGYKWADLNYNNSGIGFEEVDSSQTGIKFSNNLSDKHITENRNLLNGSGVAAGDIDGDGLVDLYFTQLDGPNKLYRNLGGFSFSDITDSAGVGYSGHYSTGTTFADVDGDGDLDLFVVSLGDGNALFLNDGEGHFHLDKDSGLSDQMGSTTLTLADIDGDHDLDLYVSNYKIKTTRDLYSPDQLVWKNMVKKEGNSYKLRSPFDKNYTIIQTRNGPTLREYGEQDALYLNNGKGKFERVEDLRNHFLDENGKPFGLQADWGLAAKFIDMNNDQLPDLYVCNDYWTPDRIWLNKGNGIFEAISDQAVRKFSFSSMAVDFSDINRDGNMDYFVTEMLSPIHKTKMRQMQSVDPFIKTVNGIHNQPQEMQNTLYLNRGDTTYAEISHYSGVQATGWSWAVNFLDVDLDGYEDLIINTGNAHDFLDLDTQYYLSQKKLGKGENQNNYILQYPSLPLKNVILRNNKDLTFSNKSSSWGFNKKDISNGMALADLDNDGDLDLINNRLNENASIYRNIASKKRVAVRLKGSSPNTQGIGARIVFNNGEISQTKEIVSGGSYLSGNEASVTFGAANSQSDNKLKIIWPDGQQSMIDSVKADRIYEIQESEIPKTKISNETEVKKESRKVFRDVSKKIKHKHVENYFNDFEEQALLPIKLSQLGPGMAWIDFDQDGDDDLFIASGKGGKMGIFENKGDGTFKSIKIGLMSQAAVNDETAIIGWNTEQGTRIIVGSAHEAHTDSNSPTAYSYLVRKHHVVNLQKLPYSASSTGTLTAADYDGDGDLDLFVGGRFVPSRYPANATSHFYKNNNGRFVSDSTNNALLSDIGMVTSAVFTDYDLDGDQDLLISRAWDSILLLENDSGHFTDVSQKVGLSKFKGWWNGIATGDFNNDGFPDIITTNFGLNSIYKTNKNHSLKLFYDDFDRDKKLEVIDAYYDTLKNAYVPRRDFSDLYHAVPQISRYVRSNRQYGISSLHELLGRNLEYVPSKEINTLRQMIFINHKGKFSGKSLSKPAQFSMAFSANVGDYNNDGNEDVFLSQNFFDFPKITPRLDAGRGLWLKGNGKGNFTPISGNKSGIKIYGEQRGAALADYNNDGRIDLTISQNGSQTKLYTNNFNKRGIRIRLIGSPNNRSAVGSSVRLIYDNDLKGPRREIQSGSGYWSQNSNYIVIGYHSKMNPSGIEVTWFDGSKIRVSLSKRNLNKKLRIIRYDKN